MGTFVIEGGNKLGGSITPQGAKNEALQVISAVVLSPKKIRIRNIPEINDVLNLIELLKIIGVKVIRLCKNEYEFQADDLNLSALGTDSFLEKAGNLRGSVMIVGPLLARFGYAIMSKPGGDKIGRRRMDTHFIGLKKLGAKVNYKQDRGCFEVRAERLEGVYIHLDEPSVTGTANVVMAALGAEGFSTIYNAACEPYLQQLCKMLNSMGANIEGIGTNRLVVEGGKPLFGCDHCCQSDMIEIGSFLGLAAITNSQLTINNAIEENLGIIPNVFRQLGVKFEFKEGNRIYVPEQDIYEISSYIDGSILTIYDAPWPGFTPDLISIALVVATQAKGNVLIHQKMFESRLFFVDNLIDMGAQIILCDPHRATVMGLARANKLRGISMRSPDIRAGVALLIAALSAEGRSKIYNINQIDRGYENIEQRLRAIGANIVRLKTN